MWEKSMVEKNPVIVMRIVKKRESALCRWIAESDMIREKNGIFMVSGSYPYVSTGDVMKMLEAWVYSPLIPT